MPQVMLKMTISPTPTPPAAASPPPPGRNPWASSVCSLSRSRCRAVFTSHTSWPPPRGYNNTFAKQTLLLVMPKAFHQFPCKPPVPSASESRKEPKVASGAEPLAHRKCSLRFSLALTTSLNVFRV